MSWFNWLFNLFKTSGVEQLSPSDIVPAGSIMYLKVTGKLEINIAQLNIPFTKLPKVWTPHIPDTGSMDPVSDFGHNNIFIAGADEADHKKLIDFLKVGDVAAYRIPADMTKSATAFINHRIVVIGRDSQGRYFRFKGDNNSSIDPFTIRDNNLKWLSVGVIY